MRVCAFRSERAPRADDAPSILAAVAALRYVRILNRVAVVLDSR
jgi:hypothetical protein